jgi:hypothetical protein
MDALNGADGLRFDVAAMWGKSFTCVGIVDVDNVPSIA